LHYVSIELNNVVLRRTPDLTIAAMGGTVGLLIGPSVEDITVAADLRLVKTTFAPDRQREAERAPEVAPDHQALQDPIDFDRAMALAATDPAAFDEWRQELIEAVIQSSPGEQRQLRGLQFRIDLTCLRSPVALKRVLSVSELMWDAFLQLQQELDGLVDGLHQLRTFSRAHGDSSAKIVAFARKPNTPLEPSLTIRR
jgi:hypothetical protein